ncbi:hypothetical protein RIR_jg35717.t1 [Rhizophagus irregularis DAOM 181602=DAOM 197198]|nr:hypothetical protein RIR_jg35717.t1 [Rhizophagus irregularis DAOM 181602=DAOM 197198]CAB5183883.1 unnamed protein product [Rhizophagus irregularis]
MINKWIINIHMKVSSAFGATNDVGCVRAVSLIFDVKCVRDSEYDVRRIRTSSAYCSSEAIYNSRCVEARVATVGHGRSSVGHDWSRTFDQPTI